MKKFTQSFISREEDSAISQESGALPVFSTPSMIAKMENCATKLLSFLPPNETSVGIEIHARHLKASKIGDELTYTAQLIGENGRIFEFEIEVRNNQGELIGTATHKRAVISIDSFMNKLDNE